ncbi:hypothetical protein L0F63_000016 [Massospora cicadina]|nr:hypothetical protein L0F63_000016 [Massospora cicadina]
MSKVEGKLIQGSTLAPVAGSSIATDHPTDSSTNPHNLANQQDADLLSYPQKGEVAPPNSQCRTPVNLFPRLPSPNVNLRPSVMNSPIINLINLELKAQPIESAKDAQTNLQLVDIKDSKDAVKNLVQEAQHLETPISGEEYLKTLVTVKEASKSTFEDLASCKGSVKQSQIVDTVTSNAAPSTPQLEVKQVPSTSKPDSEITTREPQTRLATPSGTTFATAVDGQSPTGYLKMIKGAIQQGLGFIFRRRSLKARGKENKIDGRLEVEVARASGNI